jgi:hypothetical protein
MFVLQTDWDALLIAIPMITILFAAMFRLDELIGKPPQSQIHTHSLSYWNADGTPVCVEPDGRVFCHKSRKTTRPKSRLPRKRRVFGVLVE